MVFIRHGQRPAETNLLIATNNAGKMEEIRTLLAGTPFVPVSPAEIGLELHVKEDGRTYEENALKKALAFAKAGGMTALADDTGLEVDALGGAPGLYSARFVPGENVSDATRRAFLLQKLLGFERPWSARFYCCVAVAQPDGRCFTTNGVCPGEIIPEQRGDYGFGYDPVFWVSSLNKTLAELSLQEKNQISHRAGAIRKALEALPEFLGFSK